MKCAGSAAANQQTRIHEVGLVRYKYNIMKDMDRFGKKRLIFELEGSSG